MRCLDHLGFAVLLGVVVCGCGDQPESVPELLQVAAGLRAGHPARAVSVRPWSRHPWVPAGAGGLLDLFERIMRPPPIDDSRLDSTALPSNGVGKDRLTGRGIRRP
jgi:hypothetical protein